MDNIVGLIRVIAYIAVSGLVIVVTGFAVAIYIYKKNQFKGE